MILSCQNICKSFSGKDVLCDVSFHIEDKEKAAIVGINGAGKTTLLKIILKELSADSGEVILSRGRTIGYLAQHQAVLETNSIYDELMSVKQDVLDLETAIRATEQQMKDASGERLEQLMNRYSSLSHEYEQKNGYACRSEVTGVLKGLGFEEADFHRPAAELSGGQKTRVALGKLLLSTTGISLTGW